MTDPQDRPTPMAAGQVALTTGQVAHLFRVDPRTVTRWADDGRLSAIRTPSGHRRYERGEVLRLFHDAHPRGAQ